MLFIFSCWFFVHRRRGQKWLSFSSITIENIHVLLNTLNEKNTDISTQNAIRDKTRVPSVQVCHDCKAFYNYEINSLIKHHINFSY